MQPLDVLKRDRNYTDTQLSNEQRFVTVKSSDRAYLALGLLSLEDDMNNLEV